METHKLDFHSTFRTLSLLKAGWLVNDSESESASPSPELVAFVDRLLTLTPEPERLDLEAAKKEWYEWLDAYSKRIRGEHDQAAELGWSSDLQKMEEERQTAMKAANPRFVLRQWLLEDVIKRVERDSDTGKRVLAKVLHVSSSDLTRWP